MVRNPILTAAVLASVMLIGTVAQGATIFGATYDNSKTADIAAGNHGDLGTLLSEQRADFRTDARRTPGDQGYLIL